MAELDTRKIRELNDHARRSFTGCRVVITRSTSELDEQVISSIIAEVRSYSQFTPQNDLYQEHDFGSFHLGGNHVFWKWDYYDLDHSMQSPDPSDPAVTARVLTIMLAEDY